jgi:hypothetical protein
MGVSTLDRSGSNVGGSTSDESKGSSWSSLAGSLTTAV